MAPAPSPNAIGLAAYRQLAGNLHVTDIDHFYWTTRKGNALRYSMWAERRRHAAPYLRAIAGNHGTEARAYLENAAEEFAMDAQFLAELTRLLPVGIDDQAHWDKTNIEKAEELLGKASVHHRSGMAALQKVAQVDFAPIEKGTADELVAAVAGNDHLTAEAALAALVKLNPDDLDVRLAALFVSEPDIRKDRADGPIHRQIIWALAKCDSDVATEAIGQAIFFPGKSDAVAPAISGWAAELYWERKGKDGRAVFVKALDSETPHVVDAGLKYLGLCEDKSVLPLLEKFEKPAAYEARIRLGDESAYPLLIAGLGTPAWFDSYSRLRAMGSQVEEHVFPFTTNANPQLAFYATVLLSRIGTEKSLPYLKASIERQPGNARLEQALADLKRRIAEAEK